MRFQIWRTNGNDENISDTIKGEGEYPWCIDISSIEELQALGDVEGMLIVSFGDRPEIEIYNTYRE